MKIRDVRCHVLLAPDVDEGLTSSAQDGFLVVIETDEGAIGIGESDLNPWIAKACLEARGTHTMGRSLRDMLIGEDPRDIARLWRKLYVGSAMNGRRGAVVHVIGAIDMALWDLRGKVEGKPVYELLGGLRQAQIVPYASLQPVTHDFASYRDSLVEWSVRARTMGFKAIKAEITMNGPYAHSGLCEPYERHTEVIEAIRTAIGYEIDLLVDVQYMWDDADVALDTLRTWEAYDLAFVETPLWCDDLEGHARLAEETTIPIASGEWLATRYEFASLMDQGRIGVAQPDVGRVGGLSEALIVADMAAERGIPIVPHCWKTGVSVAATAHFAFARQNVRYVEYLPSTMCVERLRRELADDGLTFRDGVVVPSDVPGLGCTVDMEALARFEVA